MSKQDPIKKFWLGLALLETYDGDNVSLEDEAAEEGSTCTLSGDESDLYRIDISDIDFAKESYDNGRMQILLQNNSKSQKRLYNTYLSQSKIITVKKITELT